MKELLLPVKEICNIYSIHKSVFYRIVSYYNVKAIDSNYNKLYNFYEINNYITKINEVNIRMTLYLKKKQVAEMLNVCTKTVENLLKRDSRFPKPICIGIGNKTFRWSKYELDNYIEQCKVA